MALETTNLVAVGDLALSANTGEHNTAVGASALQSVTTGTGNVGIGYAAGSNITTGSNNICIGMHAQAPSATASNQVVIGSALVAAGSDTTLQGALVGSVQALTTAAGAGAVDVTSLVTKLTSTGTDALTLANGTNGQVKVIVMAVDGGDATLTPTTKTGFSTIVFDAVGDAVTLVYFTTLGWMVVSNNGATVS